MRLLQQVILLLFLLTTWLPLPIYAEDPEEPRVLISEVLPQIADSPDITGELNWEFIELYNPTDQPIELAGWKLEYRSAGGGSWSTLIDREDEENINKTLNGTIEPRGYYLLATIAWYEQQLDDSYTISNSAPDYWDIEYLDLSALQKQSLSSAGGHIRLCQTVVDLDPPSSYEDCDEAAGISIDLLGWGGANGAEGNAAASAPIQGHSLKRLISDGVMIDSDNNNLDFEDNDSPSPRVTLAPVTEDPDPDPDPEPEPEPDPDETGDYLTVEITEILPDPTSPASDAEDEFVELYNPHNQAVNLKDYVIKTGGNLQYSYVLPSIALGAKKYKAFYSGDGNITLANSSSRIQVHDPEGNIVSDLIRYEGSKAGESWSLIGSKWQWSNRPTPGAINKASLADNPAVDNSVSTSISKSSTYAPTARLYITELLPDPASPQKDADDEFVELYNPNSFSVSLKGYVLRSGSTLRSRYALPDQVIKAGQYAVFFNSDANISLPNTGGKVILENDMGKLIYETKEYSKATEGASWILLDSKWQWTSSSTPAAANKLVSLPEQAQDSRSGSAAATGGSENGGNAFTSTAAIPQSTASNLIIASVSGLALLYALYEFRYDIRNRAELIRRRFAHRK